MLGNKNPLKPPASNLVNLVAIKKKHHDSWLHQLLIARTGPKRRAPAPRKGFGEVLTQPWQLGVAHLHGGQPGATTGDGPSGANNVTNDHGMAATHIQPAMMRNDVATQSWLRRSPKAHGDSSALPWAIESRALKAYHTKQSCNQPSVQGRTPYDVHG